MNRKDAREAAFRVLFSKDFNAEQTLKCRPRERLTRKELLKQ